MRKKKFALGKWLVIFVAVAVLAGGFWLSRERPLPEHKIDTPVELQLKPVQ